MAKNSKGNLVGGWAFLIGVILALVLGALGTINPTLMTILVIIGLIVGLLNIADEEAQPFLLSGAVLIIAASLGQDVMQTVAWIDRILDALLAIFIPATVVVAIRNVFTLAKR